MRKGIFFTILGIVLTGLFIATFAFYVQYAQSRQMDSVEIRINTMNEFLKSLENDLQRALYISSFRALISLSDYVSSSGNFLQDTQSDFLAMLLNGTVANITAPLMVNQTLPYWSGKMMILAQTIDANLSLRVLNISIYQTSPWIVKVQAAVNVSLNDKKRTASWLKTIALATTIKIEGLEDPIYIIGSNGKIARAITPSNITDWNIAALMEHFDAKTFVQNPSAPSFLQRLEGNLGSSPNGIETLVDTNELDIYGEDVKNTSSVDYIYFGNQSGKIYSIHNITDKGNPFFRLDKEHVAVYNVNGYNYTG